MGSVVTEAKQDLRYGLRLLLRNPTFTIASVLTLALGIGATSAIFSVLDAIVLRPLPFRTPDRLMWVQETNEQGAVRPPSGELLAEWMSAGQTVDAVDRVGGITQYSLSGPAGARRVRFGNVGLTTMSLLGIEPLLGRSFRADDTIVEGDTAEGIVISYGLWQGQFGGDPGVIGKPLPGWNAAWGRIVIGVMPAGFWIHPSMAEAEAWFAFDYQRMGARAGTIARLRPGATIEQARSELTAIAQRLVSDGGRSGPGGGAWRAQLVPLHDVFTANYASTLYLLLGAVSFVLLIAAVNVTNLQLGRAIARETEMSTRAALGAGRVRLMRQLVVENALLGLAGGVLGLLVAYLGIRIFVALVPQFYPPSDEIRLNATVLLFTLAVALAAGILSGLVPALRASRPDLQQHLKQGARGSVGGARQRVRRALVVAELALALVLLAGAGLMINSYVRLMNVDMGLNADNVLSMEVSFVGQDRYRTRHEQGYFSASPLIARFYADVLERVANLQGVASVGMTSYLPPTVGPSFPIRVATGTNVVREDIPTQFHEVGATYFETVRIPLLRGRTFTDLDGDNAPGVAIVNETLARQLFGDADPIGRFVLVDLTGHRLLEQDRMRQIVGLVSDTRTSMRSEPIPVAYVPYQQHLTDYAGNVPFFVHGHKDFVIRTHGDPIAVAPAVQRAFADVDPQIAVDAVMPMRQRLASAAGNERFWLRLLGLMATLAVFLAASGIYGVISYAVEQRRREFGVRVVFGAGNADILRLVAREGLLLIAAGLLIGIAASFGLTRLIANQLFGVTPMDPVTISAVAAALVVIASLASYVPSRRAVQADPLAALRTE